MTPLDPADPEIWERVRATVGRARSSSLHCAIASVDPDGNPHVTPIGSVAIGPPGTATYLDVFNVQLGRNLDRDPRCCGPGPCCRAGSPHRPASASSPPPARPGRPPTTRCAASPGPCARPC
jgi:hypothetical protein